MMVEVEIAVCVSGITLEMISQEWLGDVRKKLAQWKRY